MNANITVTAGPQPIRMSPDKSNRAAVQQSLNEIAAAKWLANRKCSEANLDAAFVRFGARPSVELIAHCIFAGLTNGPMFTSEADALEHSSEFTMGWPVFAREVKLLQGRACSWVIEVRS